MSKELVVIIAAAGKSSRFKSNLSKPFIKIHKKPILWYSLHSFQNAKFVKHIYIVIAKDMLNHFNKINKKYFKKMSKLKDVIFGGNKRQDSVFNALKYINSNGGCDFIAIHDAARPFIKEELIERIFDQVSINQACSCGIPVINTIKECDSNSFIKKHISRSNLIGIQTPQIFYYKDLFKAYSQIEDKNISFTDDTEIFSLINKKVKIIPGDNDLFKITYKRDLKVAKIVYRKNKKLWK